MDSFVSGVLQGLTTHLEFSPKHGQITFDKKRVALIHASMFGKLTGLLVNSLGIEKAGEVLTEIGYNEGLKYKRLTPLLSGQLKNDDKLTTCLNLYSLAGMSSIETKSLAIDRIQKRFYADMLLNESFEAESYLTYNGFSEKPVCWIQTGHLSALATDIFGESIIFKEIECRAAGHIACRVVGKPEHEWTLVDKTPDATVRNLVKAAPGLPFLNKQKTVNIIGSSQTLNKALQLLLKVAPTNVPVLLTGETGVGKELFAQKLHSMSSRSSKPFIAINCGAISKHLLEAELFGVERGAYTGANESRPGRFERANHGTLFLDELATLDIQSQVKLLRVLQEGELERLGDTRVRKVDVRIIAATNINLYDEVKAGRFREDLYFRLSGFPIQIPPLRERSGDIPLLINYFLPRITSAFGKNICGLTTQANAALKEHKFPGNIRELQHYLERGVILAEDEGWIDVEHIFPDESLNTNVFILSPSTEEEAAIDRSKFNDASQLVEKLISMEQSLDNIENIAVQIALEKTNGNVSRAAKLIGLSRAQLLYKLRKKVEEANPIT